MQLILCEIEKMEKFKYEGETFDLEIENDHSYNINGVIVHNSHCSTKMIAGVHRPQLSAILDCEKAIYNIDDEISIPHVKNRVICNKNYIVSDGGCRDVGDISVALAAGADFVMIGSMLAGTEECIGKIEFNENGELVKQFYGMSSDTAMADVGIVLHEYKTSEGHTSKVAYKGSAEAVIKKIKGGLASAMTYTNSKNIEDLSYAQLVRVPRL